MAARGGKSASFLRIAVLVAGLALPSLTLVPLGSLWLWEKGYLLHWALGTALALAGAWLWQRRLFGPPVALPPQAGHPAPADMPTGIDAPDPSWTPLERQAWRDVLVIARETQPDSLSSREALVATAMRTVLAVAKRLHPEVKEPLWQFTVPEALAIFERVSRRLGRFFVDNVPLSDRLTVARVLAFYRWRGAVEIAEKAYDVWRVVRLANPLVAVTNELRERLSQQMLQWGREHIARQLSDAYVLEVGRAAIDLYGGRLRIAEDAFREPGEGAGGTAGDDEQRVAQPLRVLVLGQKGVGKSSLVRALAGEVHAVVAAAPEVGRPMHYEFSVPPFPPAIAIDTPAVTAPEVDIPALASRLKECDLLLWVASATAGLELDREAMTVLRRQLGDGRRKTPPPMLVVLTHIDRLAPAGEWQPPYNLDDATRPKAVSIRRALDERAAELAVDPADIIPVRLAPEASYNVDALFARMVELAPAAERVRLARRLADTQGWSWRQLGSQAMNAGRILVKSVRRG